MNLAGKMHRALPINGVPTGRVCNAKKLDLQAHENRSILYLTALKVLRRLPGSPAGGASPDLYTVDLVFTDLDLQFR